MNSLRPKSLGACMWTKFHAIIQCTCDATIEKTSHIKLWKAKGNCHIILPRIDLWAYHKLEMFRNFVADFLQNIKSSG